MKKWRLALFEKAEELETREESAEVIFAFKRKATKIDIEATEALIGKKLPKELVDFFLATNGLKIDWTIELQGKQSKIVRGKSNILNIESFSKKEVLSWTNGNYQSTVLETKEVNNFFKVEPFVSEDFFVFDDIGFGNLVLISWENQEDVELFLACYNDKIYKLRIGIEDYFRLLEKTRGIYFWQQYLIENQSLDLNNQIPDDFHSNMERLFPEEDISEFSPPPLPDKSSAYNSYYRQKKQSNYKKEIERLFLDLQKNQAFRHVVFQPNPSVHIGVLRKIRAVLNRELPKSMLALYTSMNGFEFGWSFYDRINENIIKGKIILPPLETVFGGEGGERTRIWDEKVNKNIFWTDDLPNETLESLRPLKRIELVEGSSIDTLIKFLPDLEEPILFLKYKNDLFELDLSFEDYLSALMQTHGLEYWQFHLLTNNEQKELNIELPSLDQIQKIFPESDLSFLS
ncbi:MAG: SMI1/KNR4 family protein [Bacteroidota bacterium]